MTEIELHGRQFRVKHGRWTPVEKTPADMIMAEVFEAYCANSNEYEGGGVPDRDYCHASLIARRFKGRTQQNDNLAKTAHLARCS